MPPKPRNPAAFKSQPWVLYDTIVAESFLLGDSTNGNAVGGQTPAISSSGEINFFQSAGRTTATMPWYTNLDTVGQLSYGFQVWQIYVNIMFPAMPPFASINPNAPVSPAPIAQGPGYIPPTVRLMECILTSVC